MSAQAADLTVFDPLGLAALGCGIVLARYIFASIEKRTVRISDPKASARLPSHVDTERLLFLVFATEWVILAVFVFADRLPAQLAADPSGSAALHQPPHLILFHVLCVIRSQRLGILDHTTSVTAR